MTFTDIAAGEAVFVDANTLIYHFTADPALGTACSELLIRIKQEEIEAFTSTHVVNEMTHRLMAIEAMKIHGWPPAGLVQKLRRHPAEIQKLTAFRQATQEIPVFGIRTLSIPPDLLDAGATVSQATGLLTNDALIVAMMQAHGLTKLASNDADFDRVPGIFRYAPA